MAPPFEPTTRRPGESLDSWMERVRARAREVALQRGEAVSPPPPAAAAPAVPVAPPAAPVAPAAPVVSEPVARPPRPPRVEWSEDAALAALQAEASRRAGAVDGEDQAKYGPAGVNWFNEPPPTVAVVAALLPGPARQAAGLAVRNPPVHRAQIKPIPGEIDAEGWLARVRILPVQPQIASHTVIAVARAVVWGLGKARTADEAVRGVAQLSYESLATASKYSRAQVWRALRTLERFGLLDTFNVIERADKALLRAPNAYVLRGFTKAVPVLKEAVRSTITGAYERVDEQVRRFVGVWDMRANHLGGWRAPTSPSLRPTRPVPS